MDNTLTALPEPIRKYIDEQVASGANVSAIDYICRLVRDEQRRAAKDTLKAKVRDTLQENDVSEMTAEDWAEIRREARILAKELTIWKMNLTST
ncbi:MAG: hypothetical protein L0Y71_24845 [Gemmataceae bacterium]|nr:hypothetical protein [Gemmataceae bacterium]